MLVNGHKPLPLIPMTDIEEKEMKWLWYPYLPAMDATMIFGPGGSGKSHIAVDIASRVSTGEAFAFTDVTRKPEKVLLLSAEDDPSYVLKPRLHKAGANMSNIFIPPKFFTVDQAGLALIDYYIEEVTVGIVFIDPVVAYIGGKVDINKANEVRTFAGGLAKIANKHKIPIIYVHHARKGSEGNDNDRAMGSADFINASRSTLSTQIAPDGSRIMKHTKANYAPTGPSLSYDFGEKGFEWTGIYQEDGTRSSKAAKRSGAAEWLRKILQNGPVSSNEVEAEAKKQDFNHRTLVRAKAGIAESYLTSEGGKLKWYWRLTGGQDGIEADVPIMDGKWKAENTGRTDRELLARETERAAVASGPVVGGGSTKVRGDRPRDVQSTNVVGVDLEAWVKENL